MNPGNPRETEGGIGRILGLFIWKLFRYEESVLFFRSDKVGHAMEVFDSQWFKTSDICWFWRFYLDKRDVERDKVTFVNCSIRFDWNYLTQRTFAKLSKGFLSAIS